jgi:transposase
MDVSKDSIAVAVLSPDRDTAEVDKIFHDADSVRRLIKKVGKPKGIWACYEAGPTGYDLQRQLASMGVRCDVVAPSLIPKGSGDRVKTDRRDARRLAGLSGRSTSTPGAWRLSTLLDRPASANKSQPGTYATVTRVIEAGQLGTLAAVVG